MMAVFKSIIVINYLEITSFRPFLRRLPALLERLL